MNREKQSFRCLMVVFLALLCMSAGLAQETTTTTTDGGSPCAYRDNTWNLIAPSG